MMSYSVRVTDYQKNPMLNICDANILGKVISENELKINISKSYYGEKIVDEAEAAELLKKSAIIMQEIPGKPVHDLPESTIIKLSNNIGKLVGILHKNGVMHGDLTTSNFILFHNTVFVIDFGLSQISIKPEDHAVDLRLIKEILNSAHAKIMASSWKNFLNGYRSVVGYAYYTKITKLVSDIESRGRYAQVV